MVLLLKYDLILHRIVYSLDGFSWEDQKWILEDQNETHLDRAYVDL